MDLIARVRRFIRHHDLVRADSRVVAAVSGGSDSMALAHVLRELDGAGELRLAGVAHFNHQLRPSADRDEQFVRDAAEALGLRFVSERGHVAELARDERRSLEDAARTARYAFFERARLALDGDVVALGHTRDDQAETFLLRLIRGAGPRGLGGMHPRSGCVVRPLLDCRRADLRAWLAERTALGTPACDYVHDESNDDVGVPRNRVRAELLPLLEARFNPAIVDALATEATLLQEQWAWLEDASAALVATPGELDLAALAAAPLPLQRIAIWRAMTAASGGRQISFDHVDAVLRLIQAERSEAHWTMHAPGVRVQRIGGRIVLTNRNRSPRAAAPNLFRYPLSIPGRVEIPEAGWTVSAEAGGPMGAVLGPRATVRNDRGAADVAFVRRDLVGASLAVRNRRPGDRFRPVGLCGSKKLQDLFVDRKVARSERETVPLVVDDTDRIVWVAGYGIDEAFRITDPSQAVLVLRLTRA